MRDFAKLTNVYWQVEGAAEVLRDLLSEGNADRLALAFVCAWANPPWAF
ncbi:MAG: hypothetical protein KQI62_09075 [Deltaproteobacteria bacterium]|nr:hypothetical protein [Deltaproteobacteria bacterium]